MPVPVPEDNIALLIDANATRNNIITSMVDIFKRSTKDDMVIFYFSGHGEADEGDNSGYLLCYDAVTDNAPATALSMDELQSRINHCKAKLKVSYVDACHAGLFKSEGKGSMEADNEIIASTFMENISKADDGNVAFLASSAKQQSQESDKLGNGVFTYYLLKGLKGDADKEQKDALGYNDGLVTVGEMVTYLADKVPAATKYNQKPTVEGVYDEGFPLSVLTSNAVIADAIAKRPERKTLPVKVFSNVVTEVPADEILSPGQTFRDWQCYGTGTFINNSKYDLFVYMFRYANNTRQDESISIAAGRKITTPLISITGSTDNSIKGCADKFSNYKFYFSTTDNGVQKYSILHITLESGKNKFFLIDDKTMVFTSKQPE